MKTAMALTAAVAALIATTMAAGQMGMGGGMGNGPYGPGMMGRGMHGVSMLRRHYVMTYGLDETYAGARNPLLPSNENIRAGQALYEKSCATCHGAQGRGDGPAARGLDPPPADVTVAARTGMATDGYLDWVISEGGAPVRSAMPAFKSVLSHEEIWKIMLYLRSL